jgi:hypothetical protein
MNISFRKMQFPPVENESQPPACFAFGQPPQHMAIEADLWPVKMAEQGRQAGYQARKKQYLC